MKCLKCKEPKESDNFAYKNKRLQIRHLVCKACQRKYTKTHYLKNRDKYIDNALSHAKANRAQNQQSLAMRLLGAKCHLCGSGDMDKLRMSANMKPHLSTRPAAFDELLAGLTAVCSDCVKE